MNFGFSTLEEITRLLNIIGGHGIGINIHGCQPNLERAIHVLKSANGNDIKTEQKLNKNKSPNRKGSKNSE